MNNKPLAIYFLILAVLCAMVIVGAKALGQQGNYLAQFYMLTPAIAAILTRLFFYKPRFKDAQLRLGRISDYFKFWLFSLGITALTFALYTLLGAVSWDFSGKVFLEQLDQQFAASGQSMQGSLPPGFTPQIMLWLFFVGGLTVFNILPGIITGFGEEFGHRGFMFPLLYRIKPWIGLVGGGLIWYAWHWPLLLILPSAADYPLWQTALRWAALALGSVCTFIYLAYVYVKSESIWVVSLAHIVMNNASRSLAYLVVVREAWLADLEVALAMVVVVAVLYVTKELDIFEKYFRREEALYAARD
jgi:CAAX protease family protein